jgi:hypothetical protein
MDLGCSSKFTISYLRDLELVVSPLSPSFPGLRSRNFISLMIHWGREVEGSGSGGKRSPELL